MRPKRRAVSVALLLFIGAAGCGWVLQKAASIPTLPPLDTTFCFFVCTFLTSLSVSLSLALSCASFRLKDTTSRLLWCLPLHPLQRWLYLQLPLYLSGIITLVTIGPGLYCLALSIGLSPAYFYVALCLGTCGAYGLFHACSTSSGILPVICMSAATLTEFVCLQQFFHDPASLMWKLSLGMLYTSKCFGWLLCNRRAAASYVPKSTSRLTGKQMPVEFWYLKKMLRTSLSNLGICIILCLGIAFYCWHTSVQDAGILSTIATLIIASLTSDIRGLCRAKHPAEITALRGASYFIACYLITAVVSSIAIAPLLILMGTMQGSVFYYLQPLLGVAAGGLAGACIVPRPRDISGQCFAVLLGVALVIAPARFFDSANSLFLLIGEITILCVLIFVVEYLRNPFIWRKS